MPIRFSKRSKIVREAVANGADLIELGIPFSDPTAEGPVMIIDTPGFDDEGALGALRVRKTKQVLNKTDIAVLVIDATEGKKQCDEELIHIFKEKEIPYIIVNNKADLLSDSLVKKLHHKMDNIRTDHINKTIAEIVKTVKKRSFSTLMEHFSIHLRI